MKKEALLLVFAGFILGSVVTFVAIRTLEHTSTSNNVEQISSLDQEKFADNIGANEHFEMVQNFIKSAKENPDDVNSRITLGNIYYEKGKFKEAIQWYEEAYKIDPKNADILVNLGACYSAEDPKKSIEYFDKALEIDPKKQQALYNKVIVFLFDLKDTKSARESLKKFEETYPDMPMIKELWQEIEAVEKSK